jgi:hypothetical protein
MQHTNLRKDDMAQTNGLGIRSKLPDGPEVDEAERKVGAVLEDLEDKSDVDVKDIDLEEVVDTDAQDRPVIKKAVDIQAQERPKKKGWAS